MIQTAKTEIIDPLLNNITKVVNLTDEQQLLISEAFTIRKLQKKEYLLEAGTVSNFLYFISSGCLRAFTLEDDREVVTQFGMSGWCINDLPSYLNKQPAKQFIQAIEPSVVLQIHRHRLEELLEKVPPMERFLRIKFENAHAVLQERHLRAKTLTALERYEEFRLQYKDLEQRVPQYMIASYLGITKEFLSHLRGSR
ncbi:MAG: Crp/Fnr family transcriptional regulator [Bacteroidota bacterium]